MFFDQTEQAESGLSPAIARLDTNNLERVLIKRLFQ
jgi:hypothetical protein